MSPFRPAGWSVQIWTGWACPFSASTAVTDPISPLGQARDRYAAASSAELVRITDGRHDVLNDQTHRTVAAIVVLFLERIRQDSGPRPIAVPEQLGR